MKDGPKKYIVTADLPQDSVLGPLLWNAMYNGVLSLLMPKDITSIGFANDPAVVVVAKHSEDVELYGSETIHATTP